MNPVLWIRTAIRDAVRARRETGIPIARQVRGILWFRRRIGINRRDYYFFRLYHKHRPLGERLATLSRDDRIYLEPLLNPPARVLPGGKIPRKRRLVEAGLPAPETLGWFDPGEQPSDWGPGRFTTLVELREILDRAGAGGLVCKLNRGYGGTGFQSFTSASRDGLRHFNGETWSVERLFDHLRRSGVAWLLERRARPHPDLEAICGPAFGTVRILTVVLGPGRVEAGFAHYKLPSGTTGADNMSAGSVSAYIDPETGVLGEAYGLDGSGPFDRHPETGVRFVGRRLPFWPEIQAAARRAGLVFPELRVLGWDIGASPDGPIVLEGNTRWGYEIQLNTQRGLMQGPFPELVKQVGGTRALRRREPPSAA